MFQEKSFLNLFLRSFLFTILTVLSSPALVTAAQLILSWSDNSTNEVGFRIERRTGATGTYAEIATVGVNTASYTDVNLPNGTTYCYRVRAYNAGERPDIPMNNVPRLRSRQVTRLQSPRAGLVAAL
jgi:hypothetical protein